MKSEIAPELPPRHPVASRVSDNLVDADGIRLGAHRAAVNATRMPMLLTDPKQPDNPIVLANQSFLDMTGYSAAEIIGRNCRFLQGPDTDPKAVDQIRRAIAAFEPIDVEILNYRKPKRPGERGEAFWNALYVTPILDDDGKVAYFFASQLDVSRRHDTEQALRQAQRLEAVGRLSAGFAHDFNNMLMSIIGELELISMRDARADTVKSVKRAMQAGERAALLIQQVLAFARRQTLETRLTSLNTLISNLQGMFDRALGTAVQLSVDLEPALMQTKIDNAQAEQAVFNVLLNARGAMPNGGRVVIRTENVDLMPADRATHGALPAGPYVALSITDTGCGMTPEVLQQATDPFYTTKSVGEGNGMGLSQVSGFVQQSKGWLSLYSEPGQGTTVRMYFPAIAADVVYEDKPSSKSPENAVEGGNAQTVLVVEDDEHVLSVIKSILEHFNYAVLTATDADTALRMVRVESELDLILTDFTMPGMNGVEMARQAKILRPAVPIVLLTGYAAPEAIGIDHEFPVLRKPIKVDTLITAVKTAIRGPIGTE